MSRSHCHERISAERVLTDLLLTFLRSIATSGGVHGLAEGVQATVPNEAHTGVHEAPNWVAVEVCHPSSAVVSETIGQSVAIHATLIAEEQAVELAASTGEELLADKTLQDK